MNSVNQGHLISARPGLYSAVYVLPSHGQQVSVHVQVGDGELAPVPFRHRHFLLPLSVGQRHRHVEVVVHQQSDVVLPNLVHHAPQAGTHTRFEQDEVRLNPEVDEGGVVDDLPPVAEQLDVAVGDESSAEPGSKAEKRTALALSQRRGGRRVRGIQLWTVVFRSNQTLLEQFRLGKDSARKDFDVVFDTETSIIDTVYQYTSFTHLCVMRFLKHN